MIEKDKLSLQEMNKKIYNLRLKLNETYEKLGHTEEEVKISQELDRYIILVQKQLINDKYLTFSEKVFHVTRK